MRRIPAHQVGTRSVMVLKLGKLVLLHSSCALHPPPLFPKQTILPLRTELRIPALEDSARYFHTHLPQNAREHVSACWDSEGVEIATLLTSPQALDFHQTAAATTIFALPMRTKRGVLDSVQVREHTRCRSNLRPLHPDSQPNR